MGKLWDPFGLVLSSGPGDPGGCGFQRIVEHIFSKDVSFSVLNLASDFHLVSVGFCQRFHDYKVTNSIDHVVTNL